jgi:hypothetical protein
VAHPAHAHFAACLSIGRAFWSGLAAGATSKRASQNSLRPLQRPWRGPLGSWCSQGRLKSARGASSHLSGAYQLTRCPSKTESCAAEQVRETAAEDPPETSTSSSHSRHSRRARISYEGRGSAGHPRCTAS